MAAEAAFAFYAVVVLGQIARLLAPAYDQAFFEDDRGLTAVPPGRDL